MAIWRITKKLDMYGYNIITDGWTDRNHISVMNLCVHCKKGRSFIKFIENLANTHTGKYIFNWAENALKR